jgi:hypothetical protein
MMGYLKSHTKVSMHQIYSPFFLENKELSCPKCNWRGRAKETDQEYLFLTDALELYCPSCEQYLGFVDQEHAQMK